MNALFIAALALQGAGAGVSDEALFFDSLRQARFAELSAWMEKLPADSPLESAKPWVGRLSAAQKSLIDAINRGGVECDLKDVYPESPRAGKIVGATASTLQVQDGERKRSLIWSGLPSRVSYALAQRFLKGEAEKDAKLLPELADALGLAEELRNLVQGDWADDVGCVELLRKALAQRSLGEAQEALKPRNEERSESPSLKVAIRWLRRLQEAGPALKARQAEAAKLLPAGSSILLYDDFEGGPELLAKAWLKGSLSARPDGPVPGDRWCFKSTFTGVKEAFSELVAHYEFDGNDAASPVVEEGTWLSCRIWPSNARTVSVVMEARNGDQSDRVSRIDAPVRPEQWNRIRVRLGDVTQHRPRVAYYTLVQAVALGDRLHILRFEANRENSDRKDGYFFIDDLQLYTLKSPEAGGEK